MRLSEVTRKRGYSEGRDGAKESAGVKGCWRIGRKHRVVRSVLRPREVCYTFQSTVSEVSSTDYPE